MRRSCSGSRHRRQVLAVALAAVAGVPAGAAHADDAPGAIAATDGGLPLILTVPHDGGERIGSLPVRTTGTTVRDAGTRALAERIAGLLEGRLGQRPYLVVANFSRKYLDANRPPQDAMESPEALPAYRAYHDRIAAAIREVKSRFTGGALLLDIHGQSDDPNTTFRGTRGGLTVKALLGRFGPPAIAGDKSILGVLAARGYAVNPAGPEDLWEDPRFAGGHTVHTYGSHRADGIDAIQLEFGRQHRAQPRLADDVTEALATFMGAHGLLPK